MSENHEQKPSTGNSKLAPAARRRDIAIVGHGLSCAVGEEDFLLLGAVFTYLTAMEREPTLEALSPTGTEYSAVITCPAANSDETLPHLRMAALWLPALEMALDKLEADDVEGRVDILLLAPPTGTARGEYIDSEEWTQLAHDSLSLPENVRMTIQTLTGSVTASLSAACDGLEQGECDTLIVGAVDSLLDDLTMCELAQVRRLKTIDSAEGIAPGEGAAFLVLKNGDAISDNRPVPGYIRALSEAPEPHWRQPDEPILQGLAQAVGAAAQAAGKTTEELHCVIGILAQERAGLLEWHQTCCHLWPETLSDDQRLAMQAGELEAPQPEPAAPREILDLFISLGDPGIAAPLLGLVMACARFEFDHPPRQDIVVCEREDGPLRGAAWLVAGKYEDDQAGVA